MPFRVRGAGRGRAVLVGGGAVLLALALSGCGTDVDSAPVERKAFGIEGRTLTIVSENSSIELVSADVEQVEVERQVDGWVMLGSGPNTSWKMVDDTLTLKVTCDALTSNCDSLHRVKVPRGVSVKAGSDNGRVSAAGFDTPLDLSSDNGGVVVRDSRGPLKLVSDNGSVVAERISGTSVIARSDSGSVQLGFSTVPDLVDTVSDNGGITIDLPPGKQAYAVNASADNGDVSVEVARSDSSPHVVKARSDNGQVTVRSAN
ncbi:MULTISPECIES: DUF4097 family beta strand repeat-containing protein [unclassified Streptomyces]|uniref:DUF4097 family beta strand repeat-containing protein n=1 Tax=unclassified Streptomyces TaxID=2593676 RepID=UPI00093C6397|nr:DUF4097 family beta strand repeat-containing protein [Streptomyces sp. TSRI0281]OKI35712.1 hypothetical protein A6A29_12510 [Streptomyces sp. TSRI0281]